MILALDLSRHCNDLQGLPHDLGLARRATGFFLRVNHRILADLSGAVSPQADGIFGELRAAKEPFPIVATGDNPGWATLGSENLDDTSVQVDPKEAFNSGLDLAADDPRVPSGDPFGAESSWPDLAGFADTLRAWLDTCLNLAAELHAGFIRDLGLASQHFRPSFAASLAELPVCKRGRGGNRCMGAYDDGSITMLTTDAVILALPGTAAATYAQVTGSDYLRTRLAATYGAKEG